MRCSAPNAYSYASPSHKAGRLLGLKRKAKHLVYPPRSIVTRNNDPSPVLITKPLSSEATPASSNVDTASNVGSASAARSPSCTESSVSSATKMSCISCSFILAPTPPPAFVTRSLHVQESSSPIRSPIIGRNASRPLAALGGKYARRNPRPLGGDVQDRDHRRRARGSSKKRPHSSSLKSHSLILASASYACRLARPSRVPSK